MNSLEWRVKKLENKILGQTAGLAHVDRILEHHVGEHENVLDQLEMVAKAYRNFMDISGREYGRFVELYDKHKNLITALDESPQTSESSKAELVLAYEEDLVKYMNDINALVEKAERVLRIENWPDLNVHQDKLKDLEQITKDQHLQALRLDGKTEKLIEIYNDIISSFKSNMGIWNEKLEAYENMERKLDDE